MNSFHNGQSIRLFMFSLLLAWTNCWTNNRVAHDLKLHNAHVMSIKWCIIIICMKSAIRFPEYWYCFQFFQSDNTAKIFNVCIPCHIHEWDEWASTEVYNLNGVTLNVISLQILNLLIDSEICGTNSIYGLVFDKCLICIRLFQLNDPLWPSKARWLIIPWS